MVKDKLFTLELDFRHCNLVLFFKFCTTKSRCASHTAAFDVWWAPRESNPAPTDYAYQPWLSPPFSGLWSGLSLVFTTCPYSLYTSSQYESFARDRHATKVAEVSPNLSSSTKEQSQLTPRQPNFALSVFLRTVGRCGLSPLL